MSVCSSCEVSWSPRSQKRDLGTQCPSRESFSEMWATRPGAPPMFVRIGAVVKNAGPSTPCAAVAQDDTVKRKGRPKRAAFVVRRTKVKGCAPKARLPGRPVLVAGD